MSIEAWIASAVVVAVFGVLASGHYPPYVALLGGLTALLAGGIIDADDAFSGFSNSGVITVGVLYVVATAATLGVNYRPFVIAVAVAASASFASPLGYQTHLMVFGPGNYRFRDFVKMGIPMNLLLWGITTAIAPLVWPF